MTKYLEMLGGMFREIGCKIKGKFIFTAVVLEEPAEQLGMIKLLDETFKEKNIEYDGVVSCEATSLKLYLGIEDDF